MALLAGLLIVRVLYVLLDLSDLSPDEAYYWDWSRRPAWCYFSKPPMVAWIIGLSTSFLGDVTAAVRMPAALLATGSLAGTAVLARMLFGSRPAFWALALAAASPGSSALGLIMTIDPPLICAWSWALVLLWRALEADGVRWWLAAGLAVALGLMSKQSMLVFPALALLALALVPRWRARLASAGPWLFLAVSALPALPIVLWNRRNEWVMFAHSASHMNASVPEVSLKTFGDFTGAQVGLLSPWTWFLMLVVSVQTVRHWRGVDERAKFLWLLGALPLLGIHVLSLGQRVHANWSAPFYPAVHVLCAAWLCGVLRPLEAPRNSSRQRRGALALGSALSAILYACPLLVARLPLAGSRQDPTARVRGWQQFGQVVEAQLQRVPTPGNTILASSSRQTTSELAFYGPGQRAVYRLPEARVTSQYEVWGGPDQAGVDALLVENPQDVLSDAVVAAFASVERFGEVEVPLGRGGSRQAVLYLARGLRRWPEPGGEGR